MQVNHCGFQLTVPEVALYGSDIDPGFQQMGGVGMTQGVDGNPSFSDCGGDFRLPESALNTVDRHRRK